LADDTAILNANYHFILRYGRGVSVCDALLQRLNSTKFYKPPYCGIPEKTSVPGFTELKKVPLGIDEVVELFPRVVSFTQKQHRETDGPGWPGSLAREQYGRKLLAWRYDPAISVDNDRKPDNVIVWQGAGVSFFPSREAECGEVGKNLDPEDGVRKPQVALVLTKGNQGIDEDRTRKLFGNPHPEPQPIEMDGKPFSPLGYELGFFEYRHFYYIYTFDENNVQIRDAAAEQKNGLTVFIRHDGKTTRMCEYEWRIFELEAY
jgi:hypothetical protein